MKDFLAIVMAWNLITLSGEVPDLRSIPLEFGTKRKVRYLSPRHHLDQGTCR